MVFHSPLRPLALGTGLVFLLSHVMLPIPPILALDCAEMGELSQSDSRCWNDQLKKTISGGLSSFQGTWQMDFDRSMQEFQKSPDYDPIAMEMFSEMLRSLFDSVQLDIRGDQLTVRMEDVEEVVSSRCSTKSVTAVMIVADCVTDSETDELILQKVENGQYLKIFTAEDEECEFCLWKRVGP